MIELSNELEQKIKKLEKEKKELEQKINIVEGQKTSINNEHIRLVKYYKKYQDLQKYIGPEEYEKYKELKEKGEEEKEVLENFKEYVYKIIEENGFNKKFIEELIKKYDDARKEESNFNEYCIDINGLDKDGYNINGVDKDGVDKDGFNINNAEGTRKKYSNKKIKWIYDGKFYYDQYGFDENGFNRDGYDIYGFDKNGLNKDGFNKYGYKKSSGKVLNISSLPILLSKICTNNTAGPSDLAHSSKELINYLYDTKQITKQVYNNLIKAITYK